MTINNSLITYLTKTWKIGNKANRNILQRPDDT